MNCNKYDKNQASTLKRYSLQKFEALSEVTDLAKIGTNATPISSFMSAEKALDWQDKFSFASLKSKGLINTTNEWEFLKNAFEDAPSDECVIRWLNLQKNPFRVSHLMHTFINGYIRNNAYPKSKNNGTIVPVELHDIIIKYCNLIFIKLFYSKNSKPTEYELMSFDTNISLETLAKLYKIHTKLDPDNIDVCYAKYVRIWCRFCQIKVIFPLDSPSNPIKITRHQIDNLNVDPLRWIEVPNDYMKTDLWALENKSLHDQVLEIGIDIYDKQTRNWSFDGNNEEGKDLRICISKPYRRDVQNLISSHDQIWFRYAIFHSFFST